MGKRGLRRSHSKDDASSSQRDSGISISEDLSASDQDGGNVVKKRKPYIRVKNFECAVCGKKFGGGTDLRRHHLTHTDEKPFQCSMCDKAYRQENNLKNHMKIVHVTHKEFVCPFCGKPFPLKQRLRLHLRLHTGEKPYSCPQCPKTFARSGQLQQHLVTHDEQRKLLCEICSSTFTSAKGLKMHKERHERNRNQMCQICSKVFTCEKSLRAHLDSNHAEATSFECQICEKTINDDMQTHMKLHMPVKPFMCEVCNAAFAQKCQQVIHMRTHTGERPYQCQVCWQNFGHRSVLKLHIRKHTGEKPFRCVLCKDHIAFSQLSHLKTHMKSIHNKDKTYACEGCKDCFKTKFYLDDHQQYCEKLLALKNEMMENNINPEQDAELLSRLRYLIAVLLKKISSEEKLAKLGFEKRLIDNVIVASLKLANRTCHEGPKISELDRMKFNIQEFLEWIVPEKVMESFKSECPSIDSILDKIVTMYLKQVG